MYYQCTPAIDTLCNVKSSNDLWSGHVQFNSISSIYYLQITIRMVRDVWPVTLYYTKLDNQTSIILCDSITESYSQSCIIWFYYWFNFLGSKQLKIYQIRENVRIFCTIGTQMWYSLNLSRYSGKGTDSIIRHKN